MYSYLAASDAAVALFNSRPHGRRAFRTGAREEALAVIARAAQRAGRGDRRDGHRRRWDRSARVRTTGRRPVLCVAHSQTQLPAAQHPRRQAGAAARPQSDASRNQTNRVII